MIVRHVSLEQIQQAAIDSGVRIENHRQTSATRHLFVLRLNTAKRWQRLNHTRTRRVAAVCWHGHEAFFRALFKLAPSAIAWTCRMGAVRYTADTFEDLFEATGDANIGSMMAPCAFRDACRCED